MERMVWKDRGSAVRAAAELVAMDVGFTVSEACAEMLPTDVGFTRDSVFMTDRQWCTFVADVERETARIRVEENAKNKADKGVK